MFTLVWLYLATNQIIDMTRGTSFYPMFTFATLYADAVLIAALCARIRGNYK